MKGLQFWGSQFTHVYNVRRGRLFIMKHIHPDGPVLLEPKTWDPKNFRPNGQLGKAGKAEDLTTLAPRPKIFVFCWFVFVGDFLRRNGSHGDKSPFFVQKNTSFGRSRFFGFTFFSNPSFPSLKSKLFMGQSMASPVSMAVWPRFYLVNGGPKARKLQNETSKKEGKQQQLRWLNEVLQYIVVDFT